MRRRAALQLPVIAVFLAACASESGTPSRAVVTPNLAAAESAYYRGEFDSVKVMLASVLASARSSADSAGEARALTWLGLTAWREGDYRTAKERGEAALRLKISIGLDRELFRSYNALGLLAHSQGRYGDALKLFGQAERAAQAVGDTAGIAKAHGNRALSMVDIGDFAGARSGFETHRRFATLVGDTRGEANALANLAMLDIRLGIPHSAVEALLKARELYRVADFPVGEENVLGQLGTAYELLGDPQRSIAYLDSAIAIARKHGLSQQESEDLQLLAEVFSSMGDHPRALEYLERARKISIELEQVSELGDIAWTQAKALLAIGRDDAALVRAREARQLHSRSGSRMEAMRDNLLIAHINQRLGTNKVADSALRIALEEAKALAVPLALAEASIGMARVADIRKDASATLSALDGIEKHAENLGPGTEWEIHALRARAYARLGRSRDAVRSGKLAVENLEEVRERIGSSILRSSFTSDRAEAYARLAIDMLGSGDTAAAFSIADGARSRALLEHLGKATREPQGARIRPHVEADRLLRRIDWLMERLNEADTVSRRERGTPAYATVSAIRQELTTARREYESLLRREKSGDAGLATLSGHSRISLMQVRNSLKDDEVLLQFLVSEDRVVTFVVSEDRVAVIEIPAGAEEIASRVRLGIDAARAVSFGAPERQVLAKLYALFIEPAERAGFLSGKKTLIIVPHSSSVRLPFAALIQNGGGYLVTRYAVLTLPSAASLPLLRQQAFPVAVPSISVLAPFPGRLPGSGAEARVVGESTRGRRITGSSASETAVRLELERSGVVHLASHATMDRGTPMFSHIELASGRGRVPEDDGRLDVHEILAMSLRNELVFLSGCETAAGAAWSTSFRRGEDHVTLSQAFLFAGARNVIATLWVIDDLGAADFARAFYRGGSPRDPVQRLASAQRAMIRSSRYPAPRYWAAYTISGAGDLGSPVADTGWERTSHSTGRTP